ncbi:LuxR family transcriptional regulator [Ochrobactrum cytisi]|nr:LuxR family transcriptional regulator [Brucella cytisi]
MIPLENALDELSRIETFTALETFVIELRAAYQVANIVLHVMSSPVTKTRHPVVIATYEKNWVERYIEQDYFSIDPVVRVGAKSFLPLDWLDIDRSNERMRRLFKEAESYGVGTQGVTLSINGPGRGKSLATLTSYEPQHTWSRRRTRLLSDFHILSHFLFDRSPALAGFGLQQRSKLSPREHQCLELPARGSVPKKIAYELDLSIKTVRLYLTTAKLKLSAPNINAAIALAVRDEIILV